MKNFSKEELEIKSDAELLKILRAHNPMGGYSIGSKRGQFTRQGVIDTILRYQS